jgi:toxin ParE1/3/4
MGTYKLTSDAKDDLRRIYNHGLKKWGEAQADKYYNDFFDRFEQLAKQPCLYQPVDYIRKGYRRNVCGVDSIYYRIEDNTFEIMNILRNQDTNETVS